jgi:hypothetical protein
VHHWAYQVVVGSLGTLATYRLNSVDSQLARLQHSERQYLCSSAVSSIGYETVTNAQGVWYQLNKNFATSEYRC